MSNSRTRSQYVFIEVKRSHTAPCVTLSGPREVLNGVSSAGFNTTTGIVVCSGSTVGSGMEIRLTARAQGADNLMFLKAGLLEEVLKRGFRPVSNVTDDFLVLSREVIIDPQLTGGTVFN